MPVSIPQPEQTVVAKIAMLVDMSMDELRALWLEFYKTCPSNTKRSFMERRLAYLIQEQSLTNKNKDIVKTNQKRLRALDLSNQARPSASSKLLPGSVLTRVYQGIEYSVLVGFDGEFQFDGRTYGSLSKIAKEITGTQWSGPVFFGIKKKNESSKKKGKRKR